MKVVNVRDAFEFNPEKMKKVNLFEMTGSSMIVAPYSNAREHIVGAIGVIGPTRLNYARIIPMVDYTARLVGRMVG